LSERWRWRGTVALTAVALAFVLFPLAEPGDNVINSDWPAFATGAKLAISDPGHLYDLDVQQRVQLEVTGGRQLVTYGIHGILPFLAPAWVALVAVPFELLGTELGGRLWTLFGLLCLGLGLWLAVRPRAPALRGPRELQAQPPSSWGEAMLPAFAGVPTALLMLNSQLDGIVALGLGAAIALWSRPFLAGIALGLTLMKPQLVLPVGLAMVVARRWRVVAGWATAGVALWASFAVLNPRWVFEWLGPVGSTVQPASREVDLSHFATDLPAFQTYGVAILTAATVVGVVAMAWRCRNDFRAAAAILIGGGVLAAPHALPTDLVLVAMALAVWGRAAWYDWVVLSIAAVIAAITPAPVPALVAVPVMAWVLLRVVRSSEPLPARQPASPR
jgi:glycosyl transferase family 87